MLFVLWISQVTREPYCTSDSCITPGCLGIKTCKTLNNPYTLSQCILAGPVYTGMPLECHWFTQRTLGYHWATQRILAGYIGTPLEKLSWNSPTLECHWRNLVESDPHWDANGETLTFAAYTGTPLKGLWQRTHALTHIVKQSSIHDRLKWQDGGTPVSKWTGLCIFSLYLEFTALQRMPVMLLTHVSTSTLLCACIWYEHDYSFCVFGVASQMKSV